MQFVKLAQQFERNLSEAGRAVLSDSLGVSTGSLKRLAVGKRHDDFTFPMRCADLNVRGIRLRRCDGAKLAVRGSQEGLFIPRDIEQLDARSLLVCEGPTDTAAALDLGFSAIGRPSCSGGTRLVVEIAQRMNTSSVVIFADSDGAGQRGAESLAGVLMAYGPEVRIVTPPAPHSDLRDWRRAGLNAVLLKQAISKARPRALTIKSVRVATSTK